MAKFERTPNKVAQETPATGVKEDLSSLNAVNAALQEVRASMLNTDPKLQPSQPFEFLEAPEEIANARANVARDVAKEVFAFLEEVAEVHNKHEVSEEAEEVAVDILLGQLEEIRMLALGFIKRARKKLTDLPLSETEIRAHLLAIAEISIEKIGELLKDLLEEDELKSYLKAIGYNFVTGDDIISG